MKLPRKLKKAARHIMMTQHRPPMTSLEGGTLMQRAFVSFETIGEYPRTKWVNKAIARGKHDLKKSMKAQMQRMVDELSRPIDMDEIRRRAEGLCIKLQ